MKLAIDPMVVIPRGALMPVADDYTEYSIEKFIIGATVENALPEYYYRISYFSTANQTWNIQRVPKSDTGSYEVAGSLIPNPVVANTGLNILTFNLTKGEVLTLYVDSKDWVATVYSSTAANAAGGRHVINPSYYKVLESDDVGKRVDLIERYVKRLLPKEFTVDPTYTATCVYAVLLDDQGNPIPEFRPIANNYTVQYAPASMTKVMSALVAVDLAPLDTPITILEEDIVVGSGNNLVAGRTITLEDALYNMMLPSSNPSANAVARTLGGTQADFVALMNAKALELGATDTSFGNPSGLANANNKTTAVDMVKIACEYRKNLILDKIWKTKTHVINHTLADGSDPQQITIETSFSLPDDDSFEGHKTGTLGAMTNVITFVRLPFDYTFGLCIMNGDDAEGRTQALIDAVQTLYQKLIYSPSRKGIFQKESMRNT